MPAAERVICPACNMRDVDDGEVDNADEHVLSCCIGKASADRIEQFAACCLQKDDELEIMRVNIECITNVYDEYRTTKLAEAIYVDRVSITFDAKTGEIDCRNQVLSLKVLCMEAINKQRVEYDPASLPENADIAHLLWKACLPDCNPLIHKLIRMDLERRRIRDDLKLRLKKLKT